MHANGILIDPRRSYLTAIGHRLCGTVSVWIAVRSLSGNLFLNPVSETSAMPFRTNRKNTRGQPMNGARRGFGQFVIEIVRSMAGPSFSAAESAFIVFACIGAGVAFACYSELAGWRWSLTQQIAAGFLVFDLVGGAIAYNSVPSKMDRFERSKFVDYLPHQSVHIHPIIAAFFYTQWLPWVFGCYLVLFVLFIVFFEPKPVFGPTAVNAITVLVFALSLALIVASFVVEEGWGLYGGAIYLSLLLFSIVVFLAPVRTQSMVAASLVILMCLLNGTVIAAPPGFTWLIPVFFLKLTLGYMARARILPAVSPSA